MSAEIRIDDKVSESVEPRGLMRDPYDWFLAAAIVCLLPGLLVMLLDLWQRTDLRFAPLLPIVSLLFVLWKAKFAVQPHRKRSVATLLLLAAGVLLAWFAVLAHSAWASVAAMLLIVNAWMLERMGSVGWPFLVVRTLPFALLLILPFSDATDWANPLEASTAASTGALLDLVGVPNLVAGNTLELRDGIVGASAVCRWTASPYLLFALVVVGIVLWQRSLLVGLLTLVSVPLWASLGAVIHLTVGVYLLAEYGKSIFFETRGMIGQAVVLLVLLVCVLLTEKLLRTILLPFVAFSGEGAELHKLFNRIVYWPSRDPLRGRRPGEGRDAASFSGTRNGLILLGLLGIGIVVAGGLFAKQVSQGDYRTRIARPAAFQSLSTGVITRSSLPGDLGGMQLRDFVERRDDDKPYGDSYRAIWTFQRGLQRVQVTLNPLSRGYVRLEDHYLTPLSRLGEPTQQSAIKMAELGDVLLDEAVLLDDLYGRSYLSYASFTNSGISPVRTLSTGSTLGGEGLRNSLAMQPSVVSVAVYVEGSDRLNEEERDQVRQLLLTACVALSDRADTAE